MTKSKALSAVSVPLYLLPRTIAHQLRLFGNAVYRISVKRTHRHQYNVTVRTKSVSRELRPVPVATVEAAPVNSRGIRRRGEA
jgi:hypothetical protein